MSRFLLPLVVLTLGGSACGRTYEMDTLEVTQRYAHVYQGTCSSYLRSHITGYEYCASPKIQINLADYQPKSGPLAAVAPAPVAASSGPRDGKQVYEQVCSVCHGAEGKGVPGAFPPLAGSGEFYGDPQNMARIIVHGLSGEIVVQGATFNGVMPPQGALLSDDEIAQVATYVRTHFGNDDGEVTVEDVQAVR